MSTKDVVQIIVSAVVPIVAVYLAQQQISKRERNHRTMTLFYSLVDHVHEFARAFFRCGGNSRLTCEAIVEMTARDLIPKSERNTPEGQERDRRLAEKWEHLGNESVDSTAAIRKAAASLQADSLLLGMLFGRKSSELGAAIDALRAKAEIFDRNKTPDYFTECYPVEKEIRPATEKLLQAVVAFWKENSEKEEIA